jgi:hypothetical protein
VVTVSQQDQVGSDKHEQPLGELFRELSQDLTTLVRREMDLAKAELAQKGRRAGIGAGLFGGAGVVGLGAFGALTACFILALAHAMPAWLAALVVTVVYAAVAGLLALQGRTKVQQATPPVPEQTVETVKEDVQWAKTQLRSDKT